MNRVLALIIICLLALVLGVPGETSVSGRGDWREGKPVIERADPSLGNFVPGHLIVKFQDAASPSSVSFLAISHGLTEVDRSEGLGARLMSVPVGQETDILRKLSADERVAYAEPDYLFHPLFAPNDPSYGSEWNLQKIGMPSAWDISQGRSSVKVAVIDTGIDLFHADRPVSLEVGHNFISNQSNDVNDTIGHGTFVSGIIAAATNNGVGIASVAPGVTLRSYKGIDPATNSFPSFALGSAIKNAVDSGAKVINLSLGGPDFSRTLQAATNYAWDKGALVVAAAGNCGPSSSSRECFMVNQIEYPAAYTNVLSVGATNSSDTVAGFSTQNSSVVVSAPGQTVYSTRPTSLGSYAYGSGTSFAAPHVSALAALIWSLNPGLSNEQVGDIITTTARDLGPAGKDDSYGWGRVDAKAALTAARVYLTPTAVATATPTNAPVPSATLTPTPVPGAGGIAASSTFDTGNEGWKKISLTDNGPYDAIYADFGPANYVSSGGNPGGHIAADDLDGQTTWFDAPAKFLGDRGGSYGGSLSYDLKLSGAAVWATADAVLVGPGMVLVYRNAADPTTDWTHFTVVLNETAGWKKSDLRGAPPTQAEFKAVLSNLKALRIRSEYVFGLEYNRLDNVVLTGSAGGVSTPTATPPPVATATTQPPPPPPPGGAQVMYPSGYNIVAGPSGSTFTQANRVLYTSQGGGGYTTLMNDQGVTEGWGYWACFAADTMMTVGGNGSGSYTTTLDPGQMKMVGNPSGVKSATVWADRIYLYNPVSGYSMKFGSATLPVGAGAWVFSAAGGTVTVSAQ